MRPTALFLAALIAFGLAPVLVGPEADVSLQASLAPQPPTTQVSWTGVVLDPDEVIAIAILDTLGVDSFYAVSAGLRNPGAEFSDLVSWVLCAYVGDTLCGHDGTRYAREGLQTYQWFAGEADWQSIEFVTHPEPLPSHVRLVIANEGDEQRTFEYAFYYRVVDSRARGPTGTSQYQVIAPPFTGLEQFANVSVTANSLHFFQIRAELVGGDQIQKLAWIFRCYRPQGGSPELVAQISRHVEFWEFAASYADLVVPTASETTFCVLWFNNADSTSQTFLFTIFTYSGGVVNRTLHVNKTRVCISLPAGQEHNVFIGNLDPYGRYVASAHIRLFGALGAGDFDQKTSWYIAGNSFPGDATIREGYQLRHWTNFETPYDPWAEGTVALSTGFLGGDVYFYMKNNDSTAQIYCYFVVVWSIT